MRLPPWPLPPSFLFISVPPSSPLCSVFRCLWLFSLSSSPLPRLSLHPLITASCPFIFCLFPIMLSFRGGAGPRTRSPLLLRAALFPTPHSARSRQQPLHASLSSSFSSDSVVRACRLADRNDPCCFLSKPSIHARWNPTSKDESSAPSSRPAPRMQLTAGSAVPSERAKGRDPRVCMERGREGTDAHRHAARAERKRNPRVAKVAFLCGSTR